MEFLRRNIQLILTLTCIGWLLYNSGHSEAQDDNVLDTLTVRGLKVVDENGNVVCNIGTLEGSTVLSIAEPETDSGLFLKVTPDSSSIHVTGVLDQTIMLVADNQQSGVYLRSDNSGLLLQSSPDDSFFRASHSENVAYLGSDNSNCRMNLGYGNSKLDLFAAENRAKISMEAKTVNQEFLGTESCSTVYRVSKEGDAETSLSWLLSPGLQFAALNSDGQRTQQSLANWLGLDVDEID